jgi:hypothetical protein
MKKLLEFQKKINTIKKDAKNPHFKNSYASLPQILSEVKPILSEVGLILVQPTIDNKVMTQIIDAESGETITSELELPTGLNPQQLGSCLTYYRRYLLAGLLSLEIDDDDANLASTPQKPQFTESNFQKAKEVGATIEMIKGKYTISKEMEAKYTEYLLNN